MKRVIALMALGLLVAGCETASKSMVDVMDADGFKMALERQVPVNIEQPITISITIEGDGGAGGGIDADVDADLDERRMRP